MVISVSDEGVGIAPEELDGIFQPFRGGFERGTGLGLSIVHRIVSDYGGEVQVDFDARVRARPCSVDDAAAAARRSPRSDVRSDADR